MTDKAQATLTISTQSQIINWTPNQPHLPPAQPPVISINGNPVVPSRAPFSPTGFQIVILDAAQDPNNPGAILLNQYTSVSPASETSNNWASTYDFIYQIMRQDVLTTGNIDQQVLILASFGLDRSMGPDTDFLEMLLSYGAGKQVQFWLNNSDIGSQVGNPTSWVSFPTNYILVGSSGLGYNQGTEVYATVQGNQQSISSKISVLLEALLAKRGARHAAG